MKMFSASLFVGAALLLSPYAASAQQGAPRAETSAAAQQNVPAAVQNAADDVERAVRRFGVGVTGGVGLDPEVLDVGVHATFGPVFTPNISFRPGVELGIGELTTFLGINLEVLYTLPGSSNDTRWSPYVGAGPTFGLSRKSFETEDLENTNVTGVIIDSDSNRFDFGDTNFNSGFNFIVGMRRQSGMFLEMKATAWGVSNIRILAGFNF